MSKKLTFLFIVTFIIVLVSFSSYLAIQEAREVRGKVIKIGSGASCQLDMGGNRITNLGEPTNSKDLIIKGYWDDVPEEIWLPEGVTYQGVQSWCEINYFWWCAAGFPETWCGDGSCNGDEDMIDCPEDCGGGGCFTAETQILMADGKYKPIKEVEEGDWILTKESESSNKMVSAKVVRTSERTVNSYLVINNKLKVTDIHPIFVDREWKRVGAIELGNKLLSEKGEEVVVKSLEVKREGIKVYNLEIEGPETYFAGGFYVHNKPPENGEPPPAP